ncbi:MAG: hypothetical protein ACI4RN_05355 [Oscillospiraceae bacterium]
MTDKDAVREMKILEKQKLNIFSDPVQKVLDTFCNYHRFDMLEFNQRSRIIIMLNVVFNYGFMLGKRAERRKGVKDNER